MTRMPGRLIGGRGQPPRPPVGFNPLRAPSAPPPRPATVTAATTRQNRGATPLGRAEILPPQDLAMMRLTQEALDMHQRQLGPVRLGCEQGRSNELNEALWWRRKLDRTEVVQARIDGMEFPEKVNDTFIEEKDFVKAVTEARDVARMAQMENRGSIKMGPDWGKAERLAASTGCTPEPGHFGGIGANPNMVGIGAARQLRAPNTAPPSRRGSATTPGDSGPPRNRPKFQEPGEILGRLGTGSGGPSGRCGTRILQQSQDFGHPSRAPRRPGCPETEKTEKGRLGTGDRGLGSLLKEAQMPVPAAWALAAERWEGRRPPGTAGSGFPPSSARPETGKSWVSSLMGHSAQIPQGRPSTGASGRLGTGDTRTMTLSGMNWMGTLPSMRPSGLQSRSLTPAVQE